MPDELATLHLRYRGKVYQVTALYGTVTVEIPSAGFYIAIPKEPGSLVSDIYDETTGVWDYDKLTRLLNAYATMD